MTSGDEGRRQKYATGMAPSRARIGLLGVVALLLGLAFAPAQATASTVSIQSAELDIEGDNDDDVINVSTDGTTLTVTDTGTGGATAGTDCTQAGATTVTCPAVDQGFPIVHFFVTLNDGVDSFTNQNFVTRSFSQISASGSGSKAINAGPGDQFINGGPDNDVLNGGEGEDSLRDGAFSSGTENLTGGTDVLDGGPGEDSADYFRESAVAVSLDGVANDGAPGENDNVIVENVGGGNGNDVLIGDATRNGLFGNNGSDVVNGLGGNDSVSGGFGGGGQVRLVRRGLSGFEGDDTVIGGTGRDELFCGSGFDVGIRDPLDDVSPDCERIGASVVGDSATVGGKKKNLFKVSLTCPESEGVPCTGKLKVKAAGKKIGKGKFSVAAGKTKNGSAKLSKKGLKALKKAGGRLLVTVRALTTEPGGVSEDAGTILVQR